MEQAPPGWTSTRLGNLALEVRNGISARPDADKGTPILRISAVRPMALNISDRRFLSGPASEWQVYGLKRDDLLFTRYNGNPALVGVCARVRDDSAELLVYPDKIIRVRVDQRLAVPAFIEKVVHVGAARAFIDGKTKTSAGQIGISGSDLKEVPIWLPPLTEQRRIVAKLEALQARSRRAREALDAVPPLLEKLRQSILAAAFRGDLTKDWRAQNPNTEPASALLARIRTERRKKWEESELAKLKAKGKPPTDDRWKAKYKEPEPVDTTGLPELPEGWCWASVDELLADELANGRSVPTDDNGFPVLRLTALRNGKLDLTERKGGAWSAKEAAPYLVCKGDFLVSRGNGSISLVGRGGLVETEPDGVAFPDTLIRIRVHGEVDARYLSQVWTSTFVRKQIERCAKTTAGIFKVSQGDIERTIVPIPSLAEQLRMVAILDSRLEDIRRLGLAAGAAMGANEMLDRAMLAKAFRGELVPQDPNDEPAEAMLSRLRSESASEPPRARGRRIKAAE